MARLSPARYAHINPYGKYRFQRRRGIPPQTPSLAETARFQIGLALFFVHLLSEPQVHGHDRAGELADAMKGGTAVVVERHERITGYATVLAFFGHAVAETNLDLQALIASAEAFAEAFAGPGIIVPTRNSGLFRWCLENGLRSCPANDADDLGAVQRTGRGISAFRTLLKRSPSPG